MRSLFELFLIKNGDDLLPGEEARIREENLFKPYQMVKTAFAACSWPPGTEPPHLPDDLPDGTNPSPSPDEPQDLPNIIIRDPTPLGTGITLYGNGKININTAWDPTLRALGFDKETVRRILAYRFKGGVFESTGSAYIVGQLKSKDCLRQNEAVFQTINDNIESVVSEGKVKVNSEYFRIRIEIKTNGGATKIAVVVLKRYLQKTPPELKIKIVNIWENCFL